MKTRTIGFVRSGTLVLLSAIVPELLGLRAGKE